MQRHLTALTARSGLIAPVYHLPADRGARNAILRERGFNYLVPMDALGMDGDALWVADLRLLVPVEKGWLVGAATANGFTDEAGYERLARQLTSQFARPAYATTLIEGLLKPLSVLLAEITETYDGQDPIVEVALALGRSRLDPTTAQVIFLRDGPMNGELRERILAWGRNIIERPPDGINVLMPRIAELDEITAREYRTLDPVDISAFSPELDNEPLAADTETSTEPDADATG